MEGIEGENVGIGPYPSGRPGQYYCSPPTMIIILLSGDAIYFLLSEGHYRRL